MTRPTPILASRSQTSHPKTHSGSVKKFLELAGSEGLPLVLVDDVTVATGRYPTRTELATWAGLEVPAAAPSGVTMLGLADDNDSCCTPGESTCC